MKITWGTGIFLFYSLFATALFVQVYQSTRYDHSLVARDYYAKDIAYQGMLDKKQNSLSLPEAVRFEFLAEDRLLRVRFPTNLGEVSGELIFYRPQRARDDLRFDLKTDEDGIMLVPLDHIASGYWRVQADWQANRTSYFDESRLMIPKPL